MSTISSPIMVATSTGSKLSCRAIILPTASMGFTAEVNILSSHSFPTSKHLPDKYIYLGHYTIGGDPGGDFFASPGDPAFFLHHAQIDRTYWIWQNQDLPTRQYNLSGTITLDNSPPSRNGTLNDTLDIGILGPNIEIGAALNTLAGPFCYIYL